MFVLFYVVIISFTYLMVHSEGETKCECSDRAVIKKMVQEILSENKLELTRLRRREARQRKAVHSSLSPVFSVRLEELEQRLMVMEMRLNDTITKSKEEQAGFDQNIGKVVEEILERERKNIIVEINTKLDEMQKVNKSYQGLATDLFNVDKSVNEARYRIALLDKLDVEKKDRLEKLEHIVENLEMKVEEKEATASIHKNIIELNKNFETFKVAMKNTIDEHFTQLNETSRSVVSKMNRKILEYREIIDTFNLTMNVTIDEVFKQTKARQTEQLNKMKDDLASFENMTVESIAIVFGDLTTFKEDIMEVNRRLDGIEQVNKSTQILSTNLNAVNQSMNGARQMIESLDKIVTGNNVRLENFKQNVEDMDMKLNETITAFREQQAGFGRNLGTTVKKMLKAEKKERAHFVSAIKRKIMEYNESIETFKIIMDNSMNEHLKHINASQNEQSRELKEGLAAIENMTANSISLVFSNLSTFQVDTVVDINRRLDGIQNVNKSTQILASDLITVNESVYEARHMITSLDKLIKDEKEWLPWSAWGSCFYEQCNAGLRQRIRKCASQFGCTGNSEDYSICHPPTRDVRLVGGNDTFEGRLEVFYHGGWGTVCNDEFDENDARVVCKMLGIKSGAVEVFLTDHFGRGTCPIMLDDVNCSGSESNIFLCSHRGWQNHNCGHNEDVGIRCGS